MTVKTTPRNIVFLICASLVSLVSLPVPAQPMHGPEGMSPMWDGGWSGWFFGPIMMIVLAVAAITAIVLLVRWIGGSGRDTMAHRRPPSEKTPLDILKERFARGEIDNEEFEERRRRLDE